MRTALFPGSFDPFHNGHLEIVEAASQLFERVVVAPMRNTQKGEPLFTLEERREMIAALPDGVAFEVQLVMNLAVVGNALYRKEQDAYTVQREYGACAELYTALGLESL